MSTESLVNNPSTAAGTNTQSANMQSANPSLSELSSGFPGSSDAFDPNNSSLSQDGAGGSAGSNQAMSSAMNTGTTSGPSSGSASQGNPSANQSSSTNNQNAGGASTSLTQGNTPEPAQPGQDPSQPYSGMTAREKAAMNTNPANANSSDKPSKTTTAPAGAGSSTASQSPTKPQRRPRSNESSVAGGHNWSSRRYSPNSTAVTRPMNLVVMEDRWLVMRDGAVDKIETTITMEKGPLEARNQLLQAISNRVDSWGVAVSEGYWQPRLTIEVTPQAELSAQRLQKLLEGSELDAEFVPLQSTKR